MPFSTARRLRNPLALISSLMLAAIFPAVALAQSTPEISAYSAGNQDATLTISGENFGTTTASVTIDGAVATIVSWSNSSIVVDLPSTAGPGTVAVTAATGLSATAPFNGVERGYYLLNVNGTVTAENQAPTYGDLTTLGVSNTSPAVELIPTANNQGYWILTQNGTIYGFGNAANFGSVGASIQAVGMAVTPSGNGAWVLSSTGTVYTLGDAPNYGSPPESAPAAAIAATSDGNGYWVLDSNGTVYPFGDAANLGSPPASALANADPATYPNGTLVRVGSTSPIFLVEGTTVYHIPNSSTLLGMGYTVGTVKTVPNLNGFTLGPPLIVPYADGTVIKSQQSGLAYLVQNGLLHAFSSVNMLTASNIPSSRIIQVPAILPNWPEGAALTQEATYVPNGSLYRVGNSKTVYILNNGMLQEIATAAVFNAMGLKWSNVATVATLPAYSLGSPLTTPTILAADGTLWRVSGAVYVDEDGAMLHIPTAKLFNSLGFQWSQVVNVPSLAGFPVGTALGSASIPAGTTPTIPAVDLVPTADNGGYWILLQSGQVIAMGDATSFGEPTPAQMGKAAAISLAATPDDSGYTVLCSNGNALSFGDALPATSSSGAISLAMSTGAGTVTTSSSGFFSMAYGSFMPNYDGSYDSLLDDAAGLSAIIPTWYYEQQNPTSLAWGPGSPPQGFASVVSQAHSEGVQVWPMVGSTSVGPFQNAANISSTVSQLVAAAQQNDYDGITIDFEPSQFNGLTNAQAAQQYTNFVEALGPALHAIGKKLMVDTYAAFYPNTPYNLPAIAPYVDYINVMSYGHFDSATQAGPDAGVAWMSSVYQSAIADGVNPNQIIMGFGPYGDYWSFNNSGLDNNAPLGSDSYVSDAQVASLLSSNPAIVPVWDPTYQSEIFMTDEYVNANGQWTVNPTGEAVAPTDALSISDESTVMPQVENLQGLLNYILLRYAVDNNQPIPSYLNLNQDGQYGPATEEAVTQFQQDFSVAGATPGVYDAATQAALEQVIQSWNLGEYQYWVDTTQSMQNRVQQVAETDNLGGMAIWRLPFETNDFWQTLESTVTVAHPGQGGNN